MASCCMEEDKDVGGCRQDLCEASKSEIKYSENETERGQRNQ